MATVWVIQRRQGLDFGAAETFGEPIFLTDEGVHPADVGTIVSTARDVANQIGPEDFVLPVASVTGCMVMGSLLASLQKLGKRSIKVLIFDAKSGNYKERMLIL